MRAKNNRLITDALWPLNFLLNATGVPCYKSKKRRNAMEIYSWFWLLVVFQSELFVVMRCKTALLEVFKGHATAYDLMKALNNCLIILCSFIFDTVCHFCLVFTLPSTLKTVWIELNRIDSHVQRINLCTARKTTIVGVIYLTITVLLNLVLCIYYQLSNYWEGSWREVDLIQSIIRAFGNQWFHVVAVWIFASIAQSINAYHRELFHIIDLDTILLSRNKKLSFLAPESVFDKLNWVRDVNRAANLTQTLLGPLLSANVFSSLLYIIMFTFYAIEDLYRPVPFLWDLSDIADASVRYWVIAHTADCLRNINMRAVLILRRVRDNCVDSIHRRKITLLIAEMAKQRSDHSCLVGSVPVGKKTILKTLQTIATYLIIIFQFKIND